MSAAIILGAGDGIGGAIARRFGQGGQHVVVVRRDLDKAGVLADEINAGGGAASAFNTDVRDPDAMSELFETVAGSIGPVDVCVYNAGANTKKLLLETTPKLFRQVWELACFGGFLAAQECARHMAPRGKGTLLKRITPTSADLNELHPLVIYSRQKEPTATELIGDKGGQIDLTREELRPRQHILTAVTLLSDERT